MLHTEGICGPLCQHPSCWVSQRRLSRTVPHHVEPLPPKSKSAPKSQSTGKSTTGVSYSDYEEYDLPKQSVVNLLDEYGEDPSDRFPSKFKGRQMHERSKSIMSALELQQQNMNRSVIRDSAYRGRAPQATPASTHPEKRTMVGHVEVQEVFEFEELNRNWNDTFQTKQYYVWVPNPNKKKKKPYPPTGAPSQTSKRRGIKDITEDLVPQEVEWLREASVQFDDVWPKLKRRQRGKSGGYSSSYSRLQTYPVAEQYVPQKIPGHREPYYGIYELLDLPRDVLTNILQHVTERDLLDRQRFTQALLDALPKLELQSREIALAKSEVLKQKPMDIYDGRLKPTSRQTTEFTSQPIFLLDKDDIAEKIRSGQSSPGPLSTRPASGSQGENTPRLLNKHTPVPPIVPSAEKEDKVRIPTISLGLPVIPSGVKHTMPFRYKGVQFDFSLGPVAAQSSDDKGSTESHSERDSTIHVTVPSIPSTEEETRGMNYGMYSNYERESWVTEESAMYTTTPYAQPGVPLNTPLHTPATFHTAEFSQSLSPSPVKSFPSPLRRGPHALAGAHPQAPVNTPQGPPVTEFTQPDLTTQTTLDTIREADPDHVNTPKKPAESSQGEENQGPPPRSGKSVRFAPELVDDANSVPPGPPSSPSEKQEFDLSEVTTVKTLDGSLSVHLPTTEVPTGHSTMSHRSEEMSKPPSRNYSKMSSAYTMSPEPWPQINESEFNVSPSPDTKSATEPRAASMRDQVQSMTVNYDSQSEVSSSFNRSALQSRDSAKPASRDSENNRSSIRSRESQSGKRSNKPAPPPPALDSPAPPPPSPEPKDKQEIALNKEGTGLSQLEDIAETESEFTISARPPSNLDDESLIHTPIISAKVSKKSNHKYHLTTAQLAQFNQQRSREKSNDSIGLPREKTMTTIPSDSVTVGAGSRPDEDGSPDPATLSQPPPSTPGDLKAPHNSKTTMHPDYVPMISEETENSLFVTGVRMKGTIQSGVGSGSAGMGRSGRGLNMSRPDETRKRPVTPDNTPRDNAVEENILVLPSAPLLPTAPPLMEEDDDTSHINNTQTEQSGLAGPLEPMNQTGEQIAGKTELDTFENTEKEFQEELILAYKILSTNTDENTEQTDNTKDEHSK